MNIFNTRPIAQRTTDEPVSDHPAHPPVRVPYLKDAWRLAALPLLLLIIIPIFALFTRVSPDHIFASLGQVEVLQAVQVSLLTTLISLGVIILFGTPLAYWISRPRYRFKRLLDTLIDLPTVLPPSVAGVALLFTLGRRGLLGNVLDILGLHIAFTSAAVVLAQVFIASPFFIRSAAVGFASIDHEIIQAAQLDGASRWQVFRYILIPLARPALIGGGVMSWARALGEFGGTIIFAGSFPGITQTMPMAIYLGFESNLDMAITLAVILVIISFLSLLAVRRLVDE